MKGQTNGELDCHQNNLRTSSGWLTGSRWWKYREQCEKEPLDGKCTRQAHGFTSTVDTASSRAVRLAHPVSLTRWSFHGLFLMFAIHIGCTGIPALWVPDSAIPRAMLPNPAHPPTPTRRILRNTGEESMMRQERHASRRKPMHLPVSSRKRYCLLSGPRFCSIASAYSTLGPITPSLHTSGSHSRQP